MSKDAKMFRQTGALKIGPRLVTYMFLGVSIFTFVGFPLEMITRRNFRLEASVAALIGITLLTITAMMASSLFPSWEVMDDKFRICSVFHKTAWLDWHDIIAAKKFPRNIYAIRIDQLAWPYIGQGFSYGLGGRTLLLSPQINDSETLFEILATKRPDLFG